MNAAQLSNPLVPFHSIQRPVSFPPFSLLPSCMKRRDCRFGILDHIYIYISSRRKRIRLLAYVLQKDKVLFTIREVIILRIIM